MIVVLSVVGVENPWKRLVSLANWDEAYEVMGIIRADLVKKLIDKPESMEYLRTMKVRVKETDLEEYPRTDDEIKATVEKYS